MRLIDLDALIYAWCDGCDAPEKGMCNDDMCEFAEIVKKFPTIDAVPVVRCKDCKYYDYRENAGKAKSKRHESKTKCCCRSALIFTKPHNFCSYGERRSDD